MYYYSLYGLTIASDLNFPQLIPSKVCSSFDVEIMQRTIPDDIKELSKTKYFEIGFSRSWFINDILLVFIESGTTINYEIISGYSGYDVQSYLLGYGMSMLFHQRNKLAIHCSALSDSGNSILISGESGSGKSTITAALLKQGYCLQGDDLAVIEYNQMRQTIVYPGFPYQKLCRDAVLKKGIPIHDLIYINERKDKFLVPYHDIFESQPTYLRTIFLLVPTKEQEVTIQEITGINKLFAIYQCLFLRNFYKMTRFPPDVISKCIDIANTIPIFLIKRPLARDTVQEIVQHINCTKYLLAH